MTVITSRLRVVAVAGECVAASPFGALLRSAVAATVALGALHSLAGATQFEQNPGNPVAGTVGQSLSVTFTINGSPTPPFKFSINNPLPPGLTTVPEMVGNEVMSRFPTIAGTPRPFAKCSAARTRLVDSSQWTITRGRGSSSFEGTPPTALICSIASAAACCRGTLVAAVEPLMEKSEPSKMARSFR